MMMPWKPYEKKTTESVGEERKSKRPMRRIMEGGLGNLCKDKEGGSPEREDGRM